MDLDEIAAPEILDPRKVKGLRPVWGRSRASSTAIAPQA
jgi:hypothetical protein